MDPSERKDSDHTPWPKNTAYDPSKVKLPPNFVDTPETRRQRCQYYMEVTAANGLLGQVVGAVGKRGWTDNTLLLYTTDQGSNWPFAKWCLYDAGIRVPLIARWPGKIKAGSTSDAMVSLVDLLPTFLDTAGPAGPVPPLGARAFGPYGSGSHGAGHRGRWATGRRLLTAVY